MKIIKKYRKKQLKKMRKCKNKKKISIKKTRKKRKVSSNLNNLTVNFYYLLFNLKNNLNCFFFSESVQSMKSEIMKKMEEKGEMKKDKDWNKSVTSEQFKANFEQRVAK